MRPTQTRWFVIAVTRDGVRRTTHMTADFARLAVHDAVDLGFEVSCRPRRQAEPVLIGVRTEQVTQ